MTQTDWVGIAGIAAAQVAAIIGAMWRFSGWMARIEMKVDQVIAGRLDAHDLRINDHEARIRTLEH